MEDCLARQGEMQRQHTNYLTSYEDVAVGAVDSRSCNDFSSRLSHARACVQSPSTVRSDSPMCSATSELDIPEKNRSVTICAARGSIASRRDSAVSSVIRS